MQLLTKDIQSSLTSQAKVSERLRKNYNLHESLEDQVHRMFNAMEPGTVVPIHRHRSSDETIIVVSGAVRAIIYDDNKEVIEDVVLRAGSDTFGIDIKKGEWHKCESQETGTVMFEVKEGPYEPIGSEDLLI